MSGAQSFLLDRVDKDGGNGFGVQNLGTQAVHQVTKVLFIALVISSSEKHCNQMVNKPFVDIWTGADGRSQVANGFSLVKRCTTREEDQEFRQII